MVAGDVSVSVLSGDSPQLAETLGHSFPDGVSAISIAATLPPPYPRLDDAGVYRVLLREAVRVLDIPSGWPIWEVLFKATKNGPSTPDQAQQLIGTHGCRNARIAGGQNDVARRPLQP